MAGIPKVKITFDADFDELKKGVKGAQTEVEGFSSKIGNFAKVAGAAFAAAGVAAAAYAGKLLVDGVKSAIADEQAQIKLATSLQNVTGATDAQIAAVEAQILQTSLLTGKTDEELRPSLERLIRSTKNVAEAQKLQSLAIDIAAGSGKSLEAVSNALGKAYEGNTAALGKLGVGISSAELKTMAFDDVTKLLAKTFEGQASKQADTFAGKMQRLQVAFDEGKETVGAFVLDAITPLIDLVVKKVIPAIAQLSSVIGTKLQPVFEDLARFFQTNLIPIFTAWWNFVIIIGQGIIKTIRPILEGLFNAFEMIAATVKKNETNLIPLFNLFKTIASFVTNTLAPALGTILGAALEVVGVLISGLITGFSKLVGFITKVVNGIKDIIDLVAANPLVQGIGGLIDSVFGGGLANGGNVTAGTSYLVGERGPELFVSNKSGTIVPNHALGGRGSVINLTVNGAIDPEGTARTIIDVLNRSAARGGGAYSALVGV